MKAIAAPGYGPLERLAQVDTELRAPGPGELRVRVVASALNPADYKVLLGTLKFLHARNRPLIVGYDFSGTVEAVGPKVSNVAVGDDVFGFLPYSPGNRQGAFAESLLARADEVALKPARVSHQVAAAAATTGLAALQSLRDLGRLPAQGGRVLVTGVSGGVGSISVGIARRLQATVTAVGSGAGLELARRLGAAEVIDRTTHALPGDLRERFDVVLDASAAYRWRDWRGVLKPGGAFITTLPSLAFLADTLRSLVSDTRVHFINVKSRPADLRLLASWLEDGLEVPLASTLPVRDVARGLAQLHKTGGRIAIRVAGEFQEKTMQTKARATKTGGAFRMNCAIRATIKASPEKVWALLTDTSAFPRWNSTVTSLEGSIAEGQTLKLRVPSSPQRVFTPRVSAVKPGRSMIWSDGMAPMFKGVRTFELTPQPDGSTDFAMKEEFTGLMLPMLKGSLPDFGPVFEAYAEDLKRAAETGLVRSPP